MSTNDQETRTKIAIAWPVAHLLALAPLDVWVRLIASHGRVHPRYWIRLGFVLITSFVGTITTTHERAILALFRKRRFRDTQHINHQPGTVVILGYYRSGTTHLQNLMSCDDRMLTPRWYQCLAGQGSVFGWSVIRFVVVPFLGGTRPQDAVGFGPSWPGEDDFALCSWGLCSSIPGRLVFPSQWDDWKRWHGLDGLSDKELNRWRSLMVMYIWKLTRGKKSGTRNRDRIVLLKTPSHTARVKELDRLFNGHVRFVHLVRDPAAVIDSNVRLHSALKGHLLEDGPDVQTLRDRIVEEYAYTETKCANEANAIGDDRFVRVRYQDLRADPISTLSEIYTSLGLDWNERCEDAVREYLGHLGEYSSHKESVDLGRVSQREETIAAEMVARYRLDEPTPQTVPVEHLAPIPPRLWRGISAAMLWALVCIAAWLAIVWGVHATWQSMHLRLIPAIWICGAVIGWGARKASGTGSRSIGLVAGALTVLVVVAVAFPVSVINYNFAHEYATRDWLYHNAKYGYQGLRSVASLVYITLGTITAYRYGAWSGAGAPGGKRGNRQ